MNIRELTEAIREALNEDFSFDDVCKKEFQLYYDRHYIDLNDYVPEDIETLKSFAESYGWKLYDGCLVLNVKDRPYIDEDKAGLDFSKDEDNEKVNDVIEMFSRAMESEFGDDFVILGRSGGYWGFDNYKLEVTKDGVEKLKNAFPEYVREFYNTLDDEDKENFNINDEGDVEHTASCILSGTIGDFDEFVSKNLADDNDAVDIESDIKKNMEELSRLIDEQEEMMNTKEYWKEV